MEPLCIACQQPLCFADTTRKNGLRTGVCDACHITHSCVFNKDGSFYIQNAQKRFSHHKTIWHMTHHPKKNTTTYIVIDNTPKKVDENGKREVRDREEHILPGLVLPERFIPLVIWL